MSKVLIGYLASKMSLYFFIAFGIVLGGSLLGGLAAL